MEQRSLGKNGPLVSVLGLGAWPLGGGMGHVEEAIAIKTIHASIDQGITLIDTAQGYRTSETIIGKALKGGYRDRCFLASKVSGDYSQEGITTALENSLKALQCEVIDLYQIHSWNAQYPLEESMDTLIRFQEQGKIRYLGVSNFNAEQMQQTLDLAPFQSSQPCYNMLDREIESKDIPFCEKEGIGILAHSALAKGLLGGKYSRGYRFAKDDERSRFPRFQGQNFEQYLSIAQQLGEVAQNKGISLPELAIAWILRLPAISSVLIGVKNPEQLQAPLQAVGISFTKEELTQIDSILS